MLDLGIIRESKSPYASPVVIVKKSDESNRVCVDYRKLNKLTVFDPEPMPTAEELFQKIGNDKLSSKIWHRRKLPFEILNFAKFCHKNWQILP